MQYVPLIHEYVKIAIALCLPVFLWVKWNDIKQIFCGEDNKMSSKRVIAIMGMTTLCRLAAFVTHADDDIDNNILAVLTVIILTASAIATFPQVLDLFSKIKSIGNKEDKTISQPNNTEQRKI